MLSLFLSVFHASIGAVGLVPSAISCFFYTARSGEEIQDFWNRAKCFGLLLLLLFTTLNLFKV
jgi:hypothetical protein